MKLLILLFITIVAAEANFITYKYKSEKLEKRKAFINKKVETFKSLSDLEKAKKVNAFFNFHMKYASDDLVYGKNNHYASFEEALHESIIERTRQIKIKNCKVKGKCFKKVKKGIGLKGDCEDYTVAKLQLLEYLGLKDNRALFSDVKRANGKTRHVKVLSKIDGTEYVLDSLNKKFRKVKKEDLEGIDKRFWSSTLMLAAANSNLKKIKSN